jgi:hypothetical protein
VILGSITLLGGGSGCGDMADFDAEASSEEVGMVTQGLLEVRKRAASALDAGRRAWRRCAARGAASSIEKKVAPPPGPSCAGTESTADEIVHQRSGAPARAG